MNAGNAFENNKIISVLLIQSLCKLPKLARHVWSIRVPAVIVKYVRHKLYLIHICFTECNCPDFAEEELGKLNLNSFEFYLILKPFNRDDKSKKVPRYPFNDITV